MHAAITRSLRQRAVLQDATFDQVFSPVHRIRSSIHWTPVDVALRAVTLLAPGRVHQVLDVGSGVGKLCLVGAAVTSAMWTGIERDAAMVHAATQAAARMHVDQRTRFVHGDVRLLDWSAFDAFYLYNPFAEILFRGDDDALTRRAQYIASIEFVQHQLAHAKPGTRVVTYHGFGGDLPRGFDCIHREAAREDELCLWLKRGSHRSAAGRGACK